MRASSELLLAGTALGEALDLAFLLHSRLADVEVHVEDHLRHQPLREEEEVKEAREEKRREGERGIRITSGRLVRAQICRACDQKGLTTVSKPMAAGEEVREGGREGEKR